MIERKFIAQTIKELQIQEFIQSHLKNVGHSHTKMQRTPLGEKIVIFASRPGLIVGRKGQNIKQLTKTLKKKFELENPQIEISEVENIHLDANIMAEVIADTLERFGTGRFKGIGHKVMADVMAAGALGIEIVISGKIPSSRSKSWRFYQGYLKKCGDIAITDVRTAYRDALLKTGVVGIRVKIMPPDIKLPDSIEIIKEIEEKIEEIPEGKEASKEEEKTEEGKEEKKKTTKKKKPTRKKKKAEEKETATEEAEKKEEDKSTEEAQT